MALKQYSFFPHPMFAQCGRGGPGEIWPLLLELTLGGQLGGDVRRRRIKERLDLTLGGHRNEDLPIFIFEKIGFALWARFRSQKSLW